MSFILYPAIDLKDGKAVRLLQGDMDKSTVYGENPVKIAKEFEETGAKWIHIVDLNGAFAGKSENMDVIKSITENVNINIQVGGGIRTMDNITNMIENVGVNRVILGTVAAKNPELVQEAVNKYGDKIAVGIDAKNGMVAVNGWAEDSKIKAVDLATKMKEMGVKTIIYTDISKDGMMEGPNVAETQLIQQIGGIDVILSGGISSMDDVIAASDAQFAGAISGKAIYTGTIDLEGALKIC